MISNKVKFGNYDSKTNLNLVFKTKSIEAPEVKTNYVDVPGRAPIDLSEVLTGAPVYGNRNITIEFEFLGVVGTWPAERQLVTNAIHGKQLRIEFADDPNYYYIGRCAVAFSVNGSTMGVTVNITADPYKYSKTGGANVL